MLVLDNLIYRWQHCGGISTVWYEFTKRIIEERDDYMFVEYANSVPFNNLRALEQIPNDRIKLISDRFFLIKRYLPIHINYPKPFIFHSSYYRTCSNKKAINVITVHDFTYEYFRNGLAKDIHTFTKKRAISKADYIVCISQSTKQDLLKFYPNIDRNHIRVIYNGASNSYYPLNIGKEDFLLFVGARDGYKNFDIAVEAAARSNKLLVICGKKLSEDERTKLDRILPDKYIDKGFVTEKELNILYNKAFALLYTSSYEGFGIPVVEAQKAGCPVIATNCSSIPEVIGDKHMLCQRPCIEEIISRINILKNKASRKRIVDEGLKKSSTFSWDETYKEYDLLYSGIAKRI